MDNPKRNPLALLVGMQTGAATPEKGVEDPQKVKNRTTQDPALALLSIYTKNTKNTNSKGYMHLDAYSNIIYNSQIMEIAQVSIA